MITDIRLTAQQLLNPRFNSPHDIVSWMGAIQAQDYTMVKWAVALRSESVTLREVDKALEEGEIIRTHILRPTWHLVSKNDIRWMAKLTAKRIKSAYDSYSKSLEITADTYSQSNRLLEKMLEGNKSMTKQEIGIELNQAGIKTDDHRLNRLIGLAEQECILCSGVDKNKKPTYALFEERIPPYKDIAKEEALALLADKYFRSHSPATLQDFLWWSGLLISEARQAIGLIEEKLIKEKINEQEFFIHRSCSGVTPDNHFHFLPSFDEYLISYKDRTAALDLKHYPKAFNNYGTFHPVVLLNGKVVGNWKKITSKGKTILEVVPFEKKTRINKKTIALAENRYRRYLEE